MSSSAYFCSLHATVIDLAFALGHQAGTSLSKPAGAACLSVKVTSS